MTASALPFFDVKALRAFKDAISAEIAAKIAMECAISMSKVDISVKQIQS
jgi:hypothetical protein